MHGKSPERGAIGNWVPALGEQEPAATPPGREYGLPKLDRAAQVLIWTAAALLILLPVWIQERTNRDSRLVDFVYFYAASEIVQNSSSENIYIPEVQIAACQKLLPILHGKGSYGYFPYPPFVALLFKPAALLPFWTAYRIHQVICATLYLLGLVILLRRFLPNSRRLPSVFIPVAFAYLPFISNTWLNGQLSALGFVAIALALAEQESNHLFRSGLALSMCLYKPTLLLLIIPMLLFCKQGRVLLGLATGAIAWAAAATLAFGWHIWIAYGRLVLSLGPIERSRDLLQYVDLTAFFSLLSRSYPANRLALLCGVLVLPLLLVAWRRYKECPRLTWAVTITWTLILGPYVPIYDTLLIIPSIAVSANRLRFDRHDLAIPAFLFVFGCSWTSGTAARLAHIQLLTLGIVALGSLQLITCLRSAHGCTPLNPAATADARQQSDSIT